MTSPLQPPGWPSGPVRRARLSILGWPQLDSDRTSRRAGATSKCRTQVCTALRAVNHRRNRRVSSDIHSHAASFQYGRPGFCSAGLFGFCRVDMQRPGDGDRRHRHCATRSCHPCTAVIRAAGWRSTAPAASTSPTNPANDPSSGRSRSGVNGVGQQSVSRIPPQCGRRTPECGESQVGADTAYVLVVNGM